MYYWEFVLYVNGYKEVYYNEQMNIMKLAYYSGMFSQPSKRKPKPLNHYLKEIDKAFGKVEIANLDLEKAKDVEKTIEELKNGKRN